MSLAGESKGRVRGLLAIRRQSHNVGALSAGMDREPLIQASVAHPFVALLEREGGDPESCLHGVGLAPDLLDRPEEQVKERRLYRFLARAAAELDQPAFGLLVGDHSGLGDLGSFGSQLEQSVTLFDLLSTFTRTVSAVSSHARFWTAARGDEVWFCRAGIELLDVGEHQAELYVLGVMTQIVRLAAGPEWTPQRIRLKRRDRTREPFVAAYERAEILFAQPCTAIAFPAALLHQPLVRGTDSSLVARLRSSLRSRSCDLPDVHTAAEWVGCSSRTLQRSLALEGLTYRRLVDQVRFAAAAPLLRADDQSLVEVAFEAGYSDQAHFSRAFRRWTGETPARFRRLQGVSWRMPVARNGKKSASLRL